MSRTYRAINHWRFKGRKKSWGSGAGLRHPKTHAILVMEHYAAQDLRYLKGVRNRNRILSRGNLLSRKIVTAWDDIVISAGRETDWKY